MANLTVTAPYDLSPIKDLPMQGEKAVIAMIERASQLGPPLPLYERIAILRRVAAAIEGHTQELAKWAAREGGKPLVDSEVEVRRGVEGIRSAIHTLSTQTGHQIPMGITPTSEGRLAFTIREPLGLVAAISAFNHPFNLIVHQAVPAIAAGCPVIIKPALTTPLSCLNLVELLGKAGLPKEWCQVAICEDAVSQKLASDPRIRSLSFIGSSAVGWRLRSGLAPGVHCTLEHGGAAPVIVCQDADLDALIPPLVKGGFYHAGQVCVSVQRVFVPRQRIDEVAERLADAANALVVGDPTNPDTQVGPLILPKEVDRVEEWVSEGGKVLCGGNRLSDTCFAPTVLLDPPSTARVSTQEIFGPVVCLYPYDSLDEAIGRANALPFSFQAAVFGKELDTLLDCAKKLKGCAVIINDHTAFRTDWMPFGGRETSGLGMGGIPYAIQDLWVEKMIVIRSGVL